MDSSFSRLDDLSSRRFFGPRQRSPGTGTGGFFPGGWDIEDLEKMYKFNMEEEQSVGNQISPPYGSRGLRTHIEDYAEAFELRDGRGGSTIGDRVMLSMGGGVNRKARGLIGVLGSLRGLRRSIC